MLSVLSWIYGRGVALRNYLYDKGVFEVHDLGARVISVGNLTVGGTGKTPIVAYLAAELAKQGEKVCILTRGYGREDESNRVLVSDGKSVLVDASVGGDEPVELAEKLLGKAIVIADADRVRAAEWAKRKFGVTAFVLDDGFQHRKVKRDIDLICIDATDPFGKGKLLPAGRLREQVTNLNRTDTVVITRVEQVDDISDLRSEISDVAPNAAVIECRTTLSGFWDLTAETQRRRDGREFIDAAEIAERQCYGFCGIGNPDSFFRLLEQSGVNVTGKRSFRDHQRYTQQDIDDVESSARQLGADALVTTAKDAIKLSNLLISLPCYAAAAEVEIADADAFFRKVLTR